MPVFLKEEYQTRVANTKKAMETKGIDLLIVSQPANMNYLTGYDGWSFYVHQCVLVSLDHDEPIWIGRSMDGNGCEMTTFLSKRNIYRYDDDYVHSLEKHPMNFVADVIKQKKWDSKRIGLEMDQFYFTHKAFTILEKDLPAAKFVDANVLVNWVRVIKSKRELEFMQIAGEIAVKVINTAISSINIGVRECDAAAEIVKSQYTGTEVFGGDYPSIVPLMMAGEATKTPHLTWSDKKFKADEAVLLELSGVYKHYHAPVARTIFLGKNPPKLMLDTGKIVIDGLRETLEFIKPGVSAEEIEAKWREAISGSTIVKEARLGYSIGVNYPPDWGEQTISLRPGDKTIIKEDMVLHLIPGIWYEDVSFEIDASIQITDTGCKELYKYPIEIFTK